jgi:type IV pilus biogenesis protein CpaD/CtpE
MIEMPKSRNRLRGLYQENLRGLAADYAHMRRRLLDLNVASVRNAAAIDALLRRLQPALRASLEH